MKEVLLAVNAILLIAAAIACIVTLGHAFLAWSWIPFLISVVVFIVLCVAEVIFSLMK